MTLYIIIIPEFHGVGVIFNNNNYFVVHPAVIDISTYENQFLYRNACILVHRNYSLRGMVEAWSVLAITSIIQLALDL